MGAAPPFAWPRFLPGFVLVAAALCVYAPALRGGWIWDDAYLFVYNPDMRTWGGLARIWFGQTQADFWPLTSTLLWLEVHLWGGTHLLYHLTSLGLHLASGFLVWRLFARLGLRLAWLGGFLFVIHPLAVESVAWISESKNVLSLPLLLLAAHAWLDFDEQHRTVDYRRALLFYLAAMLAKTSVIMFPAVILLYAWWKHGGVTGRDVRRIVPFLVIALVLGLLTKASQSNFALADSEVLHRGVLARLACAGSATFFYVGKFVWPVPLIPIYPRWILEPPSVGQLATLPALAVVLVLAWWRRRGAGRGFLLGFGFYLLNLLPVCGLVTMSFHNISWVADHFVYLPMIGLIGLTIAGLDALGRSVPRAVCSGVAAVACLLLAGCSFGQARHFASELALWSYTAQANPASWLAQTNLAIALVKTGSEGLALQPAHRAVELRPNDPISYDTLGGVLSHFPARVDEAIAAYEHALALDPRFPKLHVDLGLALESAGRGAEAAEQFEDAVAQDPRDVRAYNAMVEIYSDEPGHRDDAIAACRAALRIVPDDAATHLHLANLLAPLPEHRAEADAEYRAALALAPKNMEIQQCYARFEAAGK